MAAKVNSYAKVGSEHERIIQEEAAKADLLGKTPSRAQLLILQRLVRKRCGVSYGTLVLTRAISNVRVVNRIDDIQQRTDIFKIIEQMGQRAHSFVDVRTRVLSELNIAPSNFALSCLIDGESRSARARFVG